MISSWRLFNQTTTSPERLRRDVPWLCSRSQARLSCLSRRFCSLREIWVSSIFAFCLQLVSVVSDIGGEGSYMWLGFAASLAAAIIAPIAGSLSDLLGRRYIGICGSLLIIVGMIIVGVAHSIELAIAGMAISGLGSGIAQVIGIAGIAELASVKGRGIYIGTAFVLVLPLGACSVYGRPPGNITKGSGNVLFFSNMEMGRMDPTYSRRTESPSVVNILLPSTSAEFI